MWLTRKAKIKTPPENSDTNASIVKQSDPDSRFPEGLQSSETEGLAGELPLDVEETAFSVWEYTIQI